MHMALFRVRDGFISAQVSEIFHEPLGEWKIGDECWDNPSRTRNNAIYKYAFSRTISDVLCTFKRFHNFIFHQSARWVYLGPGVKVGSLFWSARSHVLSNKIEQSHTEVLEIKLLRPCENYNAR